MQLLLRILRNIIEGLFWFIIFLSPFLAGAIIAVVLYLYHYNAIGIVVISIGAISGVILAEKIRKKYGCSTYMGRLLATPDFWPNEVEESDKKEIK
jgi:hypothetical protein